MTALAPRPDVITPQQPPRASGDRFVAGGLLLLVALFVAVQLLAGEFIPPLAVPALIYGALGVVLVRRRPRWLLAGVAGLAAVHLATSVPFLAGGLAHPETPASFVPDALILIAGLTVAAGALLGLRAAPFDRRPLAVVATMVAAGAVAVSMVATAGVESDALQADDVAVEAAGSQFPERVEVSADATVLWVDNQDPFRHTLVVEGTDVHTELPGSTAVRVATDLPAGTYRFFCDVAGHERMEGELVVR